MMNFFNYTSPENNTTKNNNTKKTNNFYPFPPSLGRAIKQRKSVRNGGFSPLSLAAAAKRLFWQAAPRSVEGSLPSFLLFCFASRAPVFLFSNQ